MNCVVCGSDLRDCPIWLRKDGYELVRCQSCGLGLRRDLPARGDVADLYASSYFKDSGGETGGYANYIADESLHRSTARRRLQRIDAAAGKTGRLLDVGAAAGFFLVEAAGRGWEARGVDASLEMVRHATDELGVHVELGFLDEVQGGPFDAITMWDYIEHSLDPAADIERAATLLEPGGILALTTGDLDSLAARLSGSRWHLLTPRHHNFFFSWRTIRALLESRGFEILDVSRPGARYSVSHVIYKLSRMLPVPDRAWKDAAGSRIGRVSVPLNLFDIVTVVARNVNPDR